LRIDGVAAARARLHHVGMTKSRREVIEESRRKGFAAGAAAAATVVLGAASLPVAAALAAVPTAWLGWKWWRHRAENGIKF
jgi:hypothetical protein